MSDEQDNGPPDNKLPAEKKDAAPNESVEGEIVDDRSKQSTKIVRRATQSAGEFVVSTTPLPSIAEMEWLQQNCPEFFDSYRKDILSEANHRRGLEVKFVHTNRYVATLAFGAVMYLAHLGSPWAAVTLFAGAAVLLCGAFVLLASRGSSGIPNLTLENRGVKQEREESHETTE